MISVLIIDEEVRDSLKDLAERAEQKPVDVATLMEKIKDSAGKQRHMRQMTEQTITIPGPHPFIVTYSIEQGHPCGDARHLSISIARAGRVPNQFAVWMVAEELGFTGSIEECHAYVENLEGHGHAINIIQPIKGTVH